MNADIIGKNAGAVWQVLDAAVSMDTKQLKKDAKLKNDRELYAALGWLAREGKIVFSEGADSKEIMVSLVQDK
ncbi:MAG: winged helix-turn-helix domain-containing protein [Duncaniella sp.]|nr:winged helix-turn-helix domain-containing protein [Duncaniella sp.]